MSAVTIPAPANLEAIYKSIQNGSDLEQLTGIEWGVNMWGSCQYTSDLQLYKLLMHSGDGLMNMLATVTFSEVGIHMIRGKFLSDHVYKIFEYYEGEEPDILQHQLTGLMNLPVPSKLDSYCRYLRDYGSLCEAAPYLAKLVGFKIKCNTGKSGYASNETAIACYLLKTRGFIGDEMSFSDFDT